MFIWVGDIMKGSGVISTGQAYTLLEVARMTPSQEEYRTIPLTQGQVAIVDAADFDWLNQYKKFHVLAWSHVSCADPVGEASKALPATLGKQLEREGR
jgi:hypothetical protein